MNRAELRSRWDRYSRNFVPEKPSGFSPEEYVLDSEAVAHQAELETQLAPDDCLVRLGFHCGGDDRGMGTLERPRGKLKELTRFLQGKDIPMAFKYKLGSGADLHVVREASAIADRDIWFIGDVHGDMLALRAARAFINSNSTRRPVYVFLGDLFDRNPFGLNVLMEVVEMLRDEPESVFLLAGNHDDGLDCSNGRFFSRIQPHQFADELNELEDDDVAEFVKAFIRIVKTLPVGLLLPNGLLAIHGGVPSRPERSVKNIWEGRDVSGIFRYIHERRSEFLVNRIQKDALTGSKMSPEYSWLELVNFSEAVEKAYEVPVKSVVRGHDHCDLCRHEWGRSDFKGNDNCPPAKAARVRDALTMTSMVMMDSVEKTLSGFLHKKFSYPTIARYDADGTVPQVFTLMFADDQAAGYVAAECEKMTLAIRSQVTELEADKTKQVEAVKTQKAWDEKVNVLKAEKEKHDRGGAELEKGAEKLQTELARREREKNEPTRDVAAKRKDGAAQKKDFEPTVSEAFEAVERRKAAEQENASTPPDKGEYDEWDGDFVDNLLKVTRKFLNWLLRSSDEGLRKKQQELAADIADEKAECARLEKEIEKAEASLSKASQAVADWQKRLDGRQSQIDDSNRRLSEQRAHVEKCKAEVERCQKATEFLKGVGK